MTNPEVEGTPPLMSPMLGDRQFELVPTLPRFAVMGLVAAQYSQSDTRIMAALWRVCQSLVKNWDEFDQHMSLHDELFDELDRFVEGSLEVYNLGPTEESPDSSTSSTKTPTTSRVVSLQRGMVEVTDPETSS